VLEVSDLHVHYGRIHAVQGVSFTVPHGAIVTIVGSNGAGKSTTLRALAGLVPVSHGRVQLDGEDITSYPAHRRVPRGLVLCPEGRRVFPRLTVLENLRMGAFTRPNRADFAGVLERVYSIFPVLKDRTRQAAGTLSGGEQQMLAIARALCAQPRVLLLDEPSMGLAPRLVDTVGDCIQAIREQGVTVLLVEQNAFMALEVADVGHVLENGRLVLTGSAAELMQDPRMRRAYLGELSG
jgi:branched-chain amino acid transport system ATP-binding protein